MKRLAIALALLTSATLPAAAQTQPQAQAPTVASAQPAPPPYSTGGLPRTPSYNAVEGQPIDSRAPEKKIDTRQFPEQTRAPYHHATDFSVTVLANTLHATWASALLPSGNLLVTERLPGAFRIVGKSGPSQPRA